MTGSGDRARARSRLHPEKLFHAGDLSAELRIHAEQRPALLVLVRMVLQVRQRHPRLLHQGKRVGMECY